MKIFLRWIHYIVPLTILIVAVFARIGFSDIIEEAQLKVFDVYQRIHPREYKPAPVRFIDIDDESLEKIGQWPWPRTYVAQMAAQLANAGTAAIGFDIVFSEPDRTSPANVLPIWPDSPDIIALRAKVSELPDHDVILGEVLAQVNAVTGFVLTEEDNKNVPRGRAGWVHGGDDPRMFLAPYAGAIVNLPVIEKSSTGNGSFNLLPETDGIIRRLPLIVRHGETLYPTLTAEVLRVAQGARSFIVKSSGASGEEAYGEHTGINHVKIGQFEVPTDALGRMWLHFTRDAPERTVPAWQLFAEDFDTKRVEGTVAVIGTSAPGLMDLRTTPLDPVQPGALVHIQALEQIFLGHYLNRPDWSEGAEAVYLLILGFLLIMALPRLGAMWSAVVGVAGIGLAIGFSWHMFTEQFLLIDPIYPAFVILLIYLSGSLIKYLLTEAEKRQVRGAFSQYLSPALVEQLADEPNRLVLGGEMRDMTFLFADIRGFTTVSEQFKGDPIGLTALINRFLTPMTDMILDRGGTIDKYMGDCIMAFWNAPLDDPQHPEHACQSALAMFSALDSLNADIKAEREAAGELFLPLNIGIGLNTGEACVGNMGSSQRFDYSVLGDTVNLASRLEGQSKNYGVGIVIGEDTSLAASEYASLELDLIAVKGKTEAVRIFTLLGGPELKSQAAFNALGERHRGMIAAYRAQDWAEATNLIRQCRKLDNFLEKPLDVLYDMYSERITAYSLDPPDADWDGVFVATSK